MTERLEQLAAKLKGIERRKVLEFFEDGNLSEATRTAYFNTFLPAKKFMRKSLLKINKGDIQRWMISERKRGASEGTLTFHLTHFKTFFRWLKRPGVVSWIKIKANHNNYPSELLTDDDIKKLIEAANNSRDKAIVAFLADSGARVGELLNMKVKDVSFDQYGGVVMVSGKTGGRRIRLIDSAPYLQRWLNDHPHKSEPGAALWWSSKKGSLTAPAIRILLYTLKKRAGLSKRIHPHGFRHSRLTKLIKLGLTEAELRIYAGWVGGSDMTKTYVHLSGKDLDQSILRIHGVIEEEPPEEKKRPLKPLACPRCETTNPADAAYCFKCSMALTLPAAVEAEKKKEHTDQLMTALLEDVDVQKLLKQKLAAMTKK